MKGLKRRKRSLREWFRQVERRVNLIQEQTDWLEDSTPRKWSVIDQFDNISETLDEFDRRLQALEVFATEFMPLVFGRNGTLARDEQVALATNGVAEAQQAQRDALDGLGVGFNEAFEEVGGDGEQ